MTTLTLTLTSTATPIPNFDFEPICDIVIVIETILARGEKQLPQGAKGFPRDQVRTATGPL